MMKLTDAERDSQLWIKILSAYKEKLDVIRSQLEHSKSWDETLRLQGEVRSVRAIISANNVPVTISPDTIGF